jgi:hypothetical protein
MRLNIEGCKLYTLERAFYPKRDMPHIANITSDMVNRLSIIKDTVLEMSCHTASKASKEEFVE